jgi:uncharacterized membrane protein (DUF4010 family)
MTALSAPLGAVAIVTVAGAFWKWSQLKTAVPQQATTGDLELTNPFSLVPALKWGALLAVILVASAMARTAFGTSGLMVTAAVSGFVDVDAINLAASRLALQGEIHRSEAALAITIAVASNTIVKGTIAWLSGGRNFGLDIAKVFGAATAGGILVAVVSLAR